MPVASSLRRRHHKALRHLEEELLPIARNESLLPVREPRVSAWSIGQQLLHVCLVDGAILDTFDRFHRGDLQPVSGGLTPMGRLVFLLGWIPRGRGKAPEFSRPEDPEPAEVREQLEATRDRLAGLDLERLADLRLTYPHPVFGILDLPRWLRFLQIHHDHHRRIIREIRVGTGG